MRVPGIAVVWAVLCCQLLLTNAQGADVLAAVPTRRDVHSLSNPDQVQVEHVALDLKVDFERRVLDGTATLDFRRKDGCPKDAPLVLDTRALVIKSVTWDGQPCKFALGTVDPILGAALTITLPPAARRVQIAYQTSPGASALQWLDASRTAGGKKPFLYTQSEAIHARSWVPLQDSPGVRITYTADIHVPPGFQAVMSADRKPAPGAGDVFSFEMKEPIPSYLLALAVGDLAFRSLGPRTGVYAEPSVVEKAATEFADTEAMVLTVEKRFGPYRWGRYDLLVLPPSFPLGGMENPKLTFATPTIIAGDKSLVNVIAHELSHSWSGNLVNNATWSDFWLNEGFTVYIERRVIEDLYGVERAAMDWSLGLKSLREEMKELKPMDQILYVKLEGRDPDDGLTGVPYEKGALFLATLERAFGRPRFDTFLRSYFDHFAFHAATTSDFVGYLQEHLLSKDPQTAARIDLNLWLYQPGLPDDFPRHDSERLIAVGQLADQWTRGKLAAAKMETSKWTTPEWLCFLQTIPEKLTVAQMTELDAAFHFTDRQNSEIADQWLVMAARSEYEPAEKRTESFLTTVGRNKFVVPIYKELVKTPKGNERARAIFARARSFYHPITVDSVEKLMKDRKAETH